MLIPSWYLDISFLQITNWIRNWRVNVSLSMWLYTVRIRTGINLMQKKAWLSCFGWGCPRSFRWPMLKRSISIWDMIDCVRPANSNWYGQRKYTEKKVLFDLISQWSGSVSPFSINWWTASVLYLDRWKSKVREDCTTRERRGQPVPKKQHGFWKCSCTLTSIQIKKYFHPGKSIFAR